MTGKSLEIQCPGCGRDAILRREPKYEGFKKVGERLFCASCKHEFADEAAVPFKVARKISLFSDDEKPKKLDLFKDEEDTRNCRRCEHYVVNPFLQRCGLHKRVVEATDSCPDFRRKAEVEDEAGASDAPSGPG